MFLVAPVSALPGQLSLPNNTKCSGTYFLRINSMNETCNYSNWRLMQLRKLKKSHHESSLPTKIITWRQMDPKVGNWAKQDLPICKLHDERRYILRSDANKVNTTTISVRLCDEVAELPGALLHIDVSDAKDRRELPEARPAAVENAATHGLCARMCSLTRSLIKASISSTLPSLGFPSNRRCACACA